MAYRASSNFHKISVMKFNGTNWENVGPAGFSNSQADYLNIVFSPSGEPYVAYMDVADSSKVAVKRFDGTDWVDVGIPGFSTSSALGISLAISPSGVPYVSYGDYGGTVTVYGKAIVMKYDGTDWDYVGIPHFSEGMVFFTSLGFSQSGEPHVAYNDSIYFGKATVMKFNGASWIYVGNPGFSEGAALYTSLAFSPSGEPHVAYGGGYGTSEKASAMRYDGTNWVYVGTEGFSEGDSQYTSLAFSPSGQPYVAFKDFANQNKTFRDSLYMAGVDVYDDISKLSYNESNGKDPHDIVVIHVGILSKMGYTDSKSVQEYVDKLKLKYPFVILTSGRGRPQNVSPNAKFIPFSVLDQHLRGIPHQKFLSVSALMKALSSKEEE